MSDFLAVMQGIFSLFLIKMNIYGHNISLWDVIMFCLLVGVVFTFFRGIIHE